MGPQGVVVVRDVRKFGIYLVTLDPTPGALRLETARRLSEALVEMFSLR